MKLSPAFIKTLRMGFQQPIDQAKTYKCQNCHRPNLKPEHVGAISHGEAYCKFCMEVKP